MDGMHLPLSPNIIIGPYEWVYGTPVYWPVNVEALVLQ